MNKNQFISHIKNSSNLTEEDLKSLTALSTSFPYCQISHILLAKAAHNSNSMLATESLKKAALYATSRKVLKKVINETAQEKDIKTVSKDKPPVKSQKIEKKPDISTKSIANQPAKKESSSSIADEIQKTLERSQSIKKDIPEDKITPASAKSPSEEKPKSTEKKKQKEKVEDQKVNLEDIGFTVFSSRLGNVITIKNDLTSEYPFDTNPYRDRIPVENVSKSDLIDEFIEKSPTISRIKPTSTQDGPIENLAEKSIRRKPTPKTETLAKLYLSQGNKKKALKIYEELLLKIPEKRTYFAAQIKKIKNN